MVRSRTDGIRRTRYDIYADILRIVLVYGYCPLTRAARSTNMPVDRAKTAIDHLLEYGLLEEDEEEGRRVFRLTTRGHEYLEIYQRLITLVGAPVSEPIQGM